MKAGRRFVAAAAALLALAALAACNGDDATLADPPETVRTEPPQATTTTTDPYAVPAVIDVAYVNRVLAGLDAVMGDVVRLVLQTRSIPREAHDRLRAIYATDAAVQRELDLFSEDAFRGFSGYRSNPGNQRTTTVELLTRTPSCLFMKVDRDYSEVGTQEAPPTTEWIAVKPVDPSRDPHLFNPTGWAYTTESQTLPRNPCSST